MPTSTDTDTAPSGAVVILYLFIFLALACTATLALFAGMVDPAYRTRIYVSMVANVVGASFAVNVFVSMNLRRRNVRRWWVAMAWGLLVPVSLLVAWRQHKRYAAA